MEAWSPSKKARHDAGLFERLSQLPLSERTLPCLPGETQADNVGARVDNVVQNARGQTAVENAMRLVIELEVLVVNAQPERRGHGPFDAAADIPAVVIPRYRHNRSGARRRRKSNAAKANIGLRISHRP